MERRRGVGYVIPLTPKTLNAKCLNNHLRSVIAGSNQELGIKRLSLRTIPLGIHEINKENIILQHEETLET